ncbi:MAG: hypothetical protein AAGI08_05925 [Bacteroidota bacterium]
MRFLNAYDYLIVAAYLLVVVGVGGYVSRFNKKTDDYFKGGGRVPWGLAMVSLFVSGFSAFMFVGAAGVTYTNGGGALVLYTLAGPCYLLGYFVYGPLWRRTRIDTPMQFLNRRYSASTTYFYTLLAVVPNVLILGIMIYTLCIFISTALGFNDLSFAVAGLTLTGFQVTLLVTGAVMVFYTMVGGLWAVVVSDSLQFVILLIFTVIMLPVAFAYLGEGDPWAGFERLANEAPAGYFDVSISDQVPIFWVAYFFNLILGYNVNWHIAQRYYSVPSERDTRKMALWCAGLSVILPLMWITPVMTVPLIYPDIAAVWPDFAKPAETAYVTLAMTVLPHGMLGLMVAAIFAATMSSADTTFNWLAAVLTKDVYVPVSERLRGQMPSERVQLLFGKASVAVMGVIAIWMALNMDRFGGAFDVYLRADSLYKPAMFVPVILGLVVTRTPWWSGIAALAAGVSSILVVGLVVNIQQGIPLTFGGLFSQINVAPFGIEMGRYEVNTIVGAGTSALVFFGSMLLNRRPEPFRSRIEALEHDLATPALDPGGPRDFRGLKAYRLTGWLTIGAGALLLVLSPLLGLLNAVAGVLAVGMGAGLLYVTRTAAPEPEATSS